VNISLAFENNAGEWFVEVHHLIPLAQGGQDVLQNTVAVCPTHHRYLHVGRGRCDLTAILQARRKAEET
jgi:predicted HNH restriction endonuclease